MSRSCWKPSPGCPAGNDRLRCRRHIGYVTLCLAQAVGLQGHVVAFEPLPANQQRLRTNLELNGLSGRVPVVAGAVGEAAGWQLFRPHLSVAMGKLTADAPDEPAAGLLEVEVMR
jgi:FkbM family methyltransferase